MCSAVLLLALLAAIDPVRIGIVALLISRPRPMRNLFAFWLGGMTTGIAVAVVVFILLHDYTLPVTRALAFSLSRPIVAKAQVAIGVLALPIAALILVHFWVRRRRPAAVIGGDASVLALEPNTPNAASRGMIRGQLASGSLVVAFAAGVAMATPPVEYVGAITAILAGSSGAGAQVGAALIFTLVAFAVAEIPLLSYLATPAKTHAVLLLVHGWMRAHRQPILAVVVDACGVLLVVAGMGGV